MTGEGWRFRFVAFDMFLHHPQLFDQPLHLAPAHKDDGFIGGQSHSPGDQLQPLSQGTGPADVCR